MRMQSDLELAKDFLEKRALSITQRGVKARVNDGTFHTFLNLSEVSAVLEMVMDGSFKTFYKEMKELGLKACK